MPSLLLSDSMRQIKKRNIKRLAVLSVLFWLPVILFSAIANEITERKPLPGDVAILDFIHRNFSTDLTRFFLIFTDLGSTIGIIALTSLVVAYCLYRHQKKKAAVFLAGVGGAAVANVIIKLIFRRDRPSLWHALVSQPGYSFPSGHAMASSALVFSLLYISWNTRWRWVAIALGLPFFILVALSRLFFGVHYPSDVVGGWLASLLWVSLVIHLFSNKSLLTTLAKVQAYFKHP